jgi:FkbM family methyltransferase
LPAGLARTVNLCRRLPTHWLGRRLALLLRHRSKHTARGPLDVEALGVRLRLHPEDNFCENRLLFMPQFYDAAEFAFLARVLRADSGFVDIGANIGIYTLVVAARLAPRGRILAIEPDPETCRRLRTNLALNALAHVRTLQVAVGERPGTLHLHRHVGNRGENELSHAASIGSEPVAVRPLADLLRETGCTAPEVMKIDIEGFEEPVLRAYFAATPPRDYPRHLIIEEKPAPRRPAQQALLEDAGYRRIARTRTNGIWRRD